MLLYVSVGRVCVWTSVLLILLSIFNAGTIITRFTRIAGELFGMLIAVLFLQEAIKVQTTSFSRLISQYLTCLVIIHFQGLISEFHAPENENQETGKSHFFLLYTNGLLAVIFSLGLVITALKSRRAKSWKYGFGTSICIYRSSLMCYIAIHIRVLDH